MSTDAKAAAERIVEELEHPERPELSKFGSDSYAVARYVLSLPADKGAEEQAAEIVRAWTAAYPAINADGDELYEICMALVRSIAAAIRGGDNG